MFSCCPRIAPPAKDHKLPMSGNTHSTQPRPQIDHHAINFLNSIRESVLHLLEPDQSSSRSPADVSLGLQTLKSIVDTMWRLAEKDRLLADAEKIKAYAEQLKAETEKIAAQKR
ncbi:hypothetical protein Q9L58_004068 [Maublancomyces gigas]|uniref:Uncharacterized protein n=1 Tax=Discina gigas TaxID=1032678 RepID=A0ABR3GM20_9PEZI